MDCFWLLKCIFHLFFPLCPPNQHPPVSQLGECISLFVSLSRGMFGILDREHKRLWIRETGAATHDYCHPWWTLFALQRVLGTFEPFFLLGVFVFYGQKNNSRVFSPTHRHRPQTYPQMPDGRECENCDRRRGWPVWAVIGLSGSIMYFNVAGWQGGPQ